MAPVVCRYYFPAGHKKNVGTLLDFLFVSHFLGCSWYFQMAPRSQVPITFHIKFEKLYILWLKQLCNNMNYKQNYEHIISQTLKALLVLQ